MTIDEAIVILQTELPGWWWRIGECRISCDATIAPEREEQDGHLLDIPEFDQGFDCDIRQPSTVADALMGAIQKAKTAKSRLNTSRS